MWEIFIFSALGLLCMIPIHFLSVEHIKLAERFGKEKGRRIGEALGIFSGWGFFLFSIGLWVSPQPRLDPLSNWSFLITILNRRYQISPIYITLAIILLAYGTWFGLNGLAEVSLKVSETHRTEKIVTSGVYSKVRHPQYLGGVLAHLGVSFLFHACFSLLLTPIVVLIYYILSLKEEEELVREFGDSYEKYRKRVPMMITKFKKIARMHASSQP